MIRIPAAQLESAAATFTITQKLNQTHIRSTKRCIMLIAQLPLLFITFRNFALDEHHVGHGQFALIARGAVLLLQLSFSTTEAYIRIHRIQKIYQDAISYQEKADSSLLTWVMLPLSDLLNAILIPNFLSTGKNWILFATNTCLISSAMFDLLPPISLSRG